MCEECYSDENRITPLLNPLDCLENHTQYTQDVVGITLDDLQVGDEIILTIRSSEIENLQKEDDNKAKIAVDQLQLGTQRIKYFPVFETEKSEFDKGV